MSRPLNRPRLSALSRPTTPRRTRSARPAFEPLEGRQLLSTTYTVRTTSDTSAFSSGSLRAAISQANHDYPNGAAPGQIVINFRIGSGPQTITPASPLPSLPAGTLVDGSTQPGFSGTPLIVLDGRNAGSSANGLTLGGSCKVLDLVVDDFSGSGLVLGGSGANVVQGDYVGTDLTGEQARPNGTGVTVLGGSNSNTIGGPSRNVISGNTNFGVNLVDSSTNVLNGNFIGTDAMGSKRLSNLVGVSLSGSSSNNQVGVDFAARPCNVISGNANVGVSVGSGARGNALYNNFVGTDVTGTKPVGNVGFGVFVFGPETVLGDYYWAGTNVISGNFTGGVMLFGSAAKTDFLIDNYIGTDATATNALGNQGQGLILSGASYDIVSSNVISGNGTDGVDVASGSDHNDFYGNLIGTDGLGAHALGNGGNGLAIWNSSYNLVGGQDVGNVISANGGNGVAIYGQAALGDPASILNQVYDNRIGTDRSGTVALGNRMDGVLLYADDNAPANSYGNRIGYPSAWLGGAWDKVAPGFGNTIAFNGWNGIEVQGVHQVGNPIRGNAIYGNHSLGIARQFRAEWDPPTLVSAQSGATTSVSGTLSTRLPGTVLFSVDIYASSPTDSPGGPQGRRYLGTLVVTTVNGFGSFSWALTGQTHPGEVITATATDYWGTTTQFSAPVFAR
jgi:titin